MRMHLDVWMFFILTPTERLSEYLMFNFKNLKISQILLYLKLWLIGTELSVVQFGL